MKVITVLILFSIFPNLKAKNSRSTLEHRITQCLGKEELEIHQNKDLSLDYFLNQLLISEFIQLNNTTLKDAFYKQACLKSDKPSREIFKILMTHFEDSFMIIDPSQTEESFSAKGFISDLVNRFPSLFTHYLVHLNKNAPTATCLEEKVPQLSEINLELRYLQDIVSFKQVVSKNNRMKKLLTQIDQIEKIFESCKKEIKPVQK